MAELLLDESTTSHLDQASELLASWPKETQLPFPNAHFRWNLAVIRLAQAVGDREAAHADDGASSRQLVSLCPWGKHRSVSRPWLATDGHLL